MEEIDVLRISVALSDPARYGALELICNSETITSQALCEILGLSPATISHHLRQLRLASLIDSTRDGRRKLHRAKRDTLDAYVHTLSMLGTGRRPARKRALPVSELVN